LTVLLVLSALAALYAAAAFFNRASVLDDLNLSDLSRSAITDIDDADSMAAGGIGIFGLVTLATFIVWIVWQFRYAKNAVALRGPTGLAPGWAIGGWFIPVGNFVLPEMQLMQAAKASDPDLPAGQPAANGRVPGSFTAWWVLFVLASVMNTVASISRGPGSDDVDFDLDKFQQGDRIAAFAMAVFIAAAIAGILMVRALTERQNRALAMSGGGQGGAPQYQQPYQQPYPSGYQQPAPAPPPPPTQSYPPPPQQTWQPPPPSAPPPPGT
jgi:hypothetical protein